MPGGWMQNLLILIWFRISFGKYPRPIRRSCWGLWRTVEYRNYLLSVLNSLHVEEFWFVSKARHARHSAFRANSPGLFALINSKLNFLLIAIKMRSKLGPQNLMGRRESDFLAWLLQWLPRIGSPGWYWIGWLGSWASALGSRLLVNSGLDRSARELVGYSAGVAHWHLNYLFEAKNATEPAIGEVVVFAVTWCQQGAKYQ